MMRFGLGPFNLCAMKVQVAGVLSKRLTATFGAQRRHLDFFENKTTLF